MCFGATPWNLVLQGASLGCEAPYMTPVAVAVAWETWKPV